MKPLVVDSSVAYKWLVPGSSEPDAPWAKELLVDHFEGRCVLTVPPLLYHEVGNILLCGRVRLEPAEIEAALHDLYSLPLDRIALEAGDAAETARLGRRYGISFYDASYLGLAEALGCDAITADARFARKAAGSGRVHLLARIARGRGRTRFPASSGP